MRPAILTHHSGARFGLTANPISRPKGGQGDGGWTLALTLALYRDITEAYLQTIDDFRGLKETAYSLPQK